MTGALNQRLRPLGHATNLNEALNGLFFLHLQVLMTVALHLLMNLSFDPSLREEMITLGYLPKLVAQLGQYVLVHYCIRQNYGQGISLLSADLSI